MEHFFNLPVGASDEHHEASPWRHRLVEAVQRETDDPDMSLAVWLRDGAPMGITQDIEAGNRFPKGKDEAGLTVDDLMALERCSRNHPSFEVLHGETRPPGYPLLEKYLDSGFGRLFADLPSAKAFHGADVSLRLWGTLPRPSLTDR